MDPIMMQPAKCDPVFRIKSLSGIRIPWNNMMRFDAFGASAEATGKPVALADFV
jgi:hypothetical protein